MDASLPIRSGVPLAPLTTLELGGPARSVVEAHDERTLVEALRWAHARGLPATVLGGGSNVVVADAGFDGMVVLMRQRGIELCRERDVARLRVQAGEPWDPLVEMTVTEGLAGFECLSGIPGLVGATPIQNVGAYGQEVAEVLTSVRVLDRRSLETRELSPGECCFGYRDSAFKRDPDRWVVLAVTFALRADGVPTVRYPELARAVQPSRAAPSLDEVRRTVLALRRRKSMVIDPEDGNRRSAGSFFTNPIVSAAEAERVAHRAVELGVAAEPSALPRFDAGEGRVKLAAGWLIERAGIDKGWRRGAVGVSSRHALALVHHGGGRTAELVALAAEIRDRVRATFGVTLRPEPVMMGFDAPPL